MPFPKTPRAAAQGRPCLVIGAGPVLLLVTGDRQVLEGDVASDRMRPLQLESFHRDLRGARSVVLVGCGTETLMK
jgi:hypothetical protein